MSTIIYILNCIRDSLADFSLYYRDFFYYIVTFLKAVYFLHVRLVSVSVVSIYVIIIQTVK